MEKIPLMCRFLLEKSKIMLILHSKLEITMSVKPMNKIKKNNVISAGKMLIFLK